MPKIAKQNNTLISETFPLVMEVFKRFHYDRLPRHAASLSYSSLLALAPIIAIAVAMLSLFSSFKDLDRSFQDFIYQFLVPAVGDELRTYLENFVNQAGQLTVIGLVIFLFTALLLLFNVEESFNSIWQIKKGRTLGTRISIYWALLTLGPLLMGASLSLSTYVFSLGFLNEAPLVSHAQKIILQTLPAFLEGLSFLLLYLIMPNVSVQLKYAFTGAIIATILFESTKRLFALYLVNFNNYQIVYGALSTLPIFLIWIYLSWLIALFGALIVSILQQRIHEKSAINS